MPLCVGFCVGLGSPGWVMCGQTRTTSENAAIQIARGLAVLRVFLLVILRFIL